VGWDSPEKTERDLKSHIEYLLISQKPRCRFLLDRLGEESELSDAAHVYHHEGDHAGVGFGAGAGLDESESSIRRDLRGIVERWGLITG
jgi:hypothetical protein